MRIGSLARSQSKFAAMFIATAATAILPLATFGQSRYATYGPKNAPSKQGPMQAIYTAPAEGPSGPPSRYVDGYGNPMIVPAGYYEPNSECYSEGGPCEGYGPGCTDPGQNDFNGPFPMGAGGTDPPNGYDLMCDTGIEGDLVDQRGPHYFDVRAEAVFLRRNETFGRQVNFTENRITPNTTPVVLSSNMLDYDTQPGFRILGRYDILPLAVVEFGYTGIFGFSSSASFTDPNPVDPITGTGNLFSLFSQFATNPASVTTPGGPMPETERSITQSIAIESDLQSAEISYRRYWLGYIPRVSGTLLAGFRYTKLNEDFLFHTEGEAAQDYTVDAINNLAGIQAGGDVWICLTQGLRFGAEAKAGLYDNHYSLTTRVRSTPATILPPNLFEQTKQDQPAFITEASLDLVVDILPSLSIRGGYELLFMDSLVLAGDNFNTGSPYNPPNPLLGPVRTPFVNDQGEAFYHGAHVGIEYIW